MRTGQGVGGVGALLSVVGVAIRTVLGLGLRLDEGELPTPLVQLFLALFHVLSDVRVYGRKDIVGC